MHGSTTVIVPNSRSITIAHRHVFDLLDGWQDCNRHIVDIFNRL
jgi:hypothetical protein